MASPNRVAPPVAGGSRVKPPSSFQLTVSSDPSVPRNRATRPSSLLAPGSPTQTVRPSTTATSRPNSASLGSAVPTTVRLDGSALNGLISKISTWPCPPATPRSGAPATAIPSRMSTENPKRPPVVPSTVSTGSMSPPGSSWTNSSCPSPSLASGAPITSTEPSMATDAPKALPVGPERVSSASQPKIESKKPKWTSSLSGSPTAAHPPSTSIPTRSTSGKGGGGVPLSNGTTKTAPSPSSATGDPAISPAVPSRTTSPTTLSVGSPSTPLKVSRGVSSPTAMS